MKTSLVPLQGARPAGEDVRVAYSKDKVKDAPGGDPDRGLSESEERELWSHYGLDYGSGGDDVGMFGSLPVVRDVSGPGTEEAMTRSEEEVRVGARKRGGARARLRKYVVAENVSEAVPVRKEKAVLEREPTTVPKERVRLGKETEVSEQEVSEQVRKERIEAEGEIER